MDDLATAVHALPPELYNIILQQFFELDDTGCNITPAYRPPIQLQINQYWRACYAKSYYQRNFLWYNDRHIHVLWMRSLPLEHLLIHAKAFRTHWYKALV